MLYRSGVPNEEPMSRELRFVCHDEDKAWGGREGFTSGGIQLEGFRRLLVISCLTAHAVSLSYVGRL